MAGKARGGQQKRRRLTPAARRVLIEEAATQVFAERGYKAATMKEIAAAAGVVASVLYDHHRSKRELYIELIERRGKSLIDRAIRPPNGPDLRAELRSGIEDFFRVIEEDPFVWRMLFRDSPAEPEIAAIYRKVHSDAASAIAGVVGAIVGEMLKSSLYGLAAWWWQNPEVDRGLLVETATTVIWDGLSAASDPQPHGAPSSPG